MLFRRKKAASPCPWREEDVAKESSVCTGETLIGFRDKATGRLQEAVLVRSRKDEEAFYRAHGLRPPR